MCSVPINCFILNCSCRIKSEKRKNMRVQKVQHFEVFLREEIKMFLLKYVFFSGLFLLLKTVSLFEISSAPLWSKVNECSLLKKYCFTRNE